MTHKEAIKEIKRINMICNSEVLTDRQKFDLIELHPFKDYPLHDDWPYTGGLDHGECVRAWNSYLSNTVLPAAEEALRIEEACEL